MTNVAKPPRKARTTIVDVARVAHVSVGTVSRVINQIPNVQPATLAAVQEAMSKLGYAPPPVHKRRGPRRLRNINQHAERSIAMIVVAEHGLRWVLECAPVYCHVLHGVESKLAEHDCSPVVRQASHWEEVTAIVQQTKAQGLILLGREPNDPPPASLSRLHLVWTMGEPRQLQCDHVRPDHFQLGVLAATHFMKAGHGSCAFIGPATCAQGNLAGLRGDGFRIALHAAGAKAHMLLDRNLIISNKNQNVANEQVLAGLIDQMLAIQPRPTAVLLHADLMAPNFYRLLSQRGIRPQVDMAIATCNNERPYLAGLQPAPVVVDPQAEAIGRCAVDQLLWRILNPHEPRRRILIEPKLVLPEAAGSDAAASMGQADASS